MMKKLLFGLMVIVTMGSCNLFIDEEPTIDENGFRDVPVHTGEGFDEPVTVQDGGCEVTYQYKSNVHVLTLDEQQRYIVSAEKDALGAFAEIHYRSDTPADVLPVAGEILVSAVTERFPWGLNHRVQNSIREDGVIKFIATFAQLTETFEQLDINGTMTTHEQEELITTPVVLPDADENEEITDMSGQAGTRAGDETTSMTAGNVKLTFEEGKQTLHIPVGIHLGVDLPKGVQGELTLDPEENYYDVVNVFDFRDFSIGQGRFITHITQTVTEVWNVQVSAGYTVKDKRLMRFQICRGKPFMVGPVVVVFFLYADLYASIDLSLSFTFSSEKKTQTEYEIDMVNMVVKKTPKVLKNTGPTFTDYEVGGSLGLSLEFHFGFGFFGKIISLRFIPVGSVTLSFSTPAYKTINGQKALDITKRPGPKIEASIKLKFGVYLDLSLKNILGSNTQLTEERMKRLQELEEDAKKQSEYYNEIFAYDDGSVNHFKDNQQGQLNEEESVTTSIDVHTWTWQYYWYPKIDDAATREMKIWNGDNQKLRQMVCVKIDDVGIFQSLFGQQYMVRLCVMKDGRFLEFVMPTSNKDRVISGGEYFFYMPEKSDDEQYTYAVCYFNEDEPDEIVAVEKESKINLTSPSVSIVDIEPTGSYRDLFINNKKDNGGYTYCWHLQFKVNVRVKGANYLEEFGTKDALRNDQKHKYNYKSDRDARDGVYSLCYDARYRTNSASATSMNFWLYCYYKVKKDDNIVYTGDEEGLEVVDGMIYDYTQWSYGEYQYEYGGTLVEGTYDNHAARRMRSFIGDDEADEGEIETVLTDIQYVGV